MRPALAPPDRRPPVEKKLRGSAILGEMLRGDRLRRGMVIGLRSPLTSLGVSRGMAGGDHLGWTEQEREERSQSTWVAVVVGEWEGTRRTLHVWGGRFVATFALNLISGPSLAKPRLVACLDFTYRAMQQGFMYNKSRYVCAL